MPTETVPGEESPGVADPASRPSAGQASGPWSTGRAREWAEAGPRIVGVNFIPSTAANTTEFWQASTFDLPTIDRELAWAGQLGFNAVRVFIQYRVWEADPEGLLDRVERFVEVAAKNHLRTIPVLFDDCAFGDPPQTEPSLGPQRPPTPGMILQSWTPSPGLRAVEDRNSWPSLERYVQAVVGRFRGSRSILFWDLYNEPGNSGMGSRSLPLLEASFQWARSARPTQPLTVGIWSDDLAPLNEAQLRLSDIVSFHAYTTRDGLRSRIQSLRRHDRPIVCTEWMARPLGSRWERDLPLFLDEEVGCISWGLVNGRTQAQFPWWSRPGASEPEVWFHDLLRSDGTPFDAQEVAAIRRLLLDGFLVSGFRAEGDVPRIRPLFDYPLRDTCIASAPDGSYYLTGTTGHPTWWTTNEGIRVWSSRNLAKWEPLGLVWSFEKDSTWQKPAPDGRRAIWAPEIHAHGGTFWIPYCVNYGGTGLLRSTSGDASGPYVDVKPSGPLTSEIDASLFVDDDGLAYFVWQNGKIARLKDDLSDLAAEPRLLAPEGAPQVGFEGAFLFKANGLYHLSCADFVQGEYHSFVATSPALFGPYGPRRLAIPHGGHNMFFRKVDLPGTEQGGSTAPRPAEWYSTFFGNDPQAPLLERPAILPVVFGLDGGVRPEPGVRLEPRVWSQMRGLAGARPWSEGRAWNWLDRHPWLVGFNYLPSTSVNDTEMWLGETFDAVTIDRELGWARAIGYNSLRVFLQYTVWRDDPEGFLARFESFLALSAKYGLLVAPILFDDCAFDSGRDPYPGRQDDPIPGVHNSRWVPSPGRKIADDPTFRGSLERYAKSVVAAHAGDARIVLWDLYNEPNSEASIPLVEQAFRWAREAGATQPLTTSLFGPAALQAKILALSDVINLHEYGPLPALKANLKAQRKYARPVIVTEWMARGQGSRFGSHLPEFQRERVGCFQWGLVAGRTQTYYPWGSPEGAPEPTLWHHDLLRADGTPFDAREIVTLGKFTGVRPCRWILAPSAEVPGEWRYTTAEPAVGWEKPGFDDSKWMRGPGPFGSREPEIDRKPGTAWATPEIWLRREVEVGEDGPRAEAKDPSQTDRDTKAPTSSPGDGAAKAPQESGAAGRNPGASAGSETVSSDALRRVLQAGTIYAWISHDEDTEVYLEGVLAAKVAGYNVGYEPEEILPEALEALKKARSEGRKITIAVHCRQTGGGQYVDVGVGE